MLQESRNSFCRHTNTIDLNLINYDNELDRQAQTSTEPCKCGLVSPLTNMHCLNNSIQVRNKIPIFNVCNVIMFIQY